MLGDCPSSLRPIQPAPMFNMSEILPELAVSGKGEDLLKKEAWIACGIKPNLQNAALAELETACGAAPYRQGHDRMMAIRALALGIQHAQVALLHQVTPRTLNNWINNFNARGIDGLIDLRRSGRPRAIAPEQAQQLRELILQPDQVGVTHWTGKKFKVMVWTDC